MKTNSTKILLAGVFSLFFFACEKIDLKSDTESLSASNTILSSSSLASTLPDCNTHCISETGPFVEKTDQKIVQWGGRFGTANSKTVDVVYYNTATEFVLKVRSTEGWSDLVIDGVSSWTGSPVAPNVWGTYTTALPSGWSACDAKNFALQVTGNGPPAELAVAYNLYAVCKGCTTEFTGEVISCGTEREVEYSFIAEEDLDYIKIQGGLTNFTGANAQVTTNVETLTDTQRTPGGSSNRVITVEGSVKACEKVTINIKWNSINTGSIITGNWSVKNSSGTELAPQMSGLVCN
jgi:hypothetical protein